MGRFFNFFGCKQGNNSARRQKMDPNIDTFVQAVIRVLAILGVEKVVLYTFSKLFKWCLYSV